MRRPGAHFYDTMMPSLHLLSQEDAIDEEVVEKSENPPKRTGSTLGNGATRGRRYGELVGAVGFEPTTS